MIIAHIASKAMPVYTLLEISPALLFSAEEYEAHGRHTVLDHYTFKWRDGRMALALGLGACTDLNLTCPIALSSGLFIRTGSLFNHSDSPNVSYTIDTATESIRYMTVRAVEPDEELCIYYGPNLWFKPVGISDEPTCTGTELALDADADDGWGSLSAVAGAGEAPPNCVLREDRPDRNEILPDEDLPFTRIKLTSDEDDEETLEAVRTGEHVSRLPARLPDAQCKVQAWAVDIPDPRHITSALKYISSLPPYPNPPLTHTPLLLPLAFPSSHLAPNRWLKSSGLETPTLSHLKRVRKSPAGTHSTLLLTSTSPTVPELSPDLDLAPPYQLTVPRSAALTPASLVLKNTLWPTVFAPRRKGEPEDWNRARAQWARAAMARAVEEARAARAAGEVRLYALPSYLRQHMYSPLTACFLSSFPSHPTSPHRRRSPGGRHTSPVTRVSPPRTLCATPHLMLCVLLLTPPPPLLPPLPLPPHRHHPHQRPRQPRTANNTCLRRAHSS